jgi:hypothetical protein
MEKAVNFFSGEFLLDGRPNGGTAVLLRSIWITTTIFIVLLPIKAYFAKDTIFLSFSFNQMKVDIGEMIPWVGAIFAGSYVALYARFAAQWNYLASLYNQLMATCIALPPTERASRGVANWKAAFIEDALDLHLARKSLFKMVIVEMLQDGDVVRSFVDSTHDGQARLQELETILNFKASSAAHSEYRTSRCLEEMTARNRAPA